jgi:putative transcriptional regulator
MKNETNYENMSVFEQLKAAMEQSLAHGRGELTLKTTTLPLPPPPASSAEVIELRKRLKMSQAVFAAALNVSTKLVQSWEQGSRKPHRGELRLIEILFKHPAIIIDLILANAAGGLAPTPGRVGKPTSKKQAAA